MVTGLAVDPPDQGADAVRQRRRRHQGPSPRVGSALTGSLQTGPGSDERGHDEEHVGTGHSHRRARLDDQEDGDGHGRDERTDDGPHERRRWRQTGIGRHTRDNRPGRERRVGELSERCCDVDRWGRRGHGRGQGPPVGRRRRVRVDCDMGPSPSSRERRAGRLKKPDPRIIDPATGALRSNHRHRVPRDRVPDLSPRLPRLTRRPSSPRWSKSARMPQPVRRKGRRPSMSRDRSTPGAASTSSNEPGLPTGDAGWSLVL